jgi:glucosylceramidase
VRPGARRIASTSGAAGIESVAFRNADDGSRVLLAVNAAAVERPLVVRASGRAFRFTLPAGAVVTFRWE